MLNGLEGEISTWASLVPSVVVCALRELYLFEVVDTPVFSILMQRAQVFVRISGMLLLNA